ncbi:japanin-like-RA1 [Rhipicephalus microplus]|uniref:japanin-like-RA1 n=1 Tax=Rhipicephalus microplus TaxID=6941 RepID=UPI003F6C955C
MKPISHLLACFVLAFSTPSMTTSTPKMPAIDTKVLYLAGYSKSLYIDNVQCVLSRIIGHKDGWVMRSLIYVFAVNAHSLNAPPSLEEADGSIISRSSTIEVRWTPYSSLMNVMTSAYVEYNLETESKYVIRTYNDESLVLSELTGGRTRCSLWVTKERLDSIPEVANRTFHHTCPDPVYPKVIEDCFDQ